MSTKERTKAAERALKNARTLCNRQRRNMKAYVAVIKNTEKALQAGDTLRALALVSGNFKYPPSMAEGLALDACEHKARRQVWICQDCGEEVLT